MAESYDLDTGSASFLACQQEYAARSEAAADLPGARFDIAYGDHPRQRMDIFPAGPKAPVLVFYRGGYWAGGSKEERWFPALEWVPRGVSWVAVNYRLAPETPLASIVEDARVSISWIAQNGAAHGLDPAQLHLVGNSAGGHLASMAAAADWAERPMLRSCTGISGLYDLEPLVDATANDWLKLDVPAARALSPVHHLPAPTLPMTLCAGAAETPAFRQQTRNFAEICWQNGNPVSYFESPDRDHFNIIGELGTPGSPVFEALSANLDRAT